MELSKIYTEKTLKNYGVNGMFFAICWTCIVVFLSVWPFSSGGVELEHTDKFVHFIMYAVTTFLYYRWKKNIQMAVLFSVALGFLMEVAQYFIEWRSFSIFDIVFNCAGIMCVFLWYFAGPGRVSKTFTGCRNLDR